MDKKIRYNSNLVEPINRYLIGYIVPKLPLYITIYNLTLMSLLWASLIIIGGYKSKKNISWLYLVICAIFLYWITDILDGQTGKYRKTGTIKWGYFMDHTLDVVVMSCIFLAIYISLSSRNNAYNIPLIIIYVNMVIQFTSTFLSISKEGMDISQCIYDICIGPSDTLGLLIILIFYIIYKNGKPSLIIFYIVISILIITNIYKIYNIQKKLHREDMEFKKQKRLL